MPYVAFNSSASSHKAAGYSFVIWIEICCASYNAALMMLCCFVLPSLSSGIVCVFGARGWQGPDVDRLLFIFNALLLSCFASSLPFFSCVLPLTCVSGLTGSDVSLSRHRLQKGDSHEV
jgi:hypothetical protein